MNNRPCYGIDYGYVCHLSKICRHVTPEATTADAMLCERLGFEHFMSHPATTVGVISRARSDAEKRGPPEVVVALKREYHRMLTPPPPTPKPEAPGASLQAAWHAPIGQTMDLFA